MLGPCQVPLCGCSAQLTTGLWGGPPGLLPQPLCQAEERTGHPGVQGESSAQHPVPGPGGAFLPRPSRMGCQALCATAEFLAARPTLSPTAVLLGSHTSPGQPSLDLDLAQNLLLVHLWALLDL